MREAEEKGLKTGLKQGLEQGERNARLEDARRMLKYGDSVEKITDITGLSIEEIRQMQKITTDEQG